MSKQVYTGFSATTLFIVIGSLALWRFFSVLTSLLVRWKVWIQRWYIPFDLTKTNLRFSLFFTKLGGNGGKSIKKDVIGYRGNVFHHGGPHMCVHQLLPIVSQEAIVDNTK